MPRSWTFVGSKCLALFGWMAWLGVVSTATAQPVPQPPPDGSWVADAVVDSPRMVSGEGLGARRGSRSAVARFTPMATSARPALAWGWSANMTWT